MHFNDLPAPPPGYTTWRYQVGVDGRLSALFVTIPFPQFTAPPWPGLPSDAEAIVAVLESGHWRPLATFACRDLWYLWDVAPDDWCVIARSRARPGEATATAFTDNYAQTPFYIGDGVSHMQCDGEGGVWIGYFDEGVFATNAILSASGLVRLSRVGEKLLSYPGYQIADCYALNVTRDRAWICYYTDFPIASMTTNGRHQEWSNATINCPSQLATHGDYVALVGGYEDQRERVAILRLTEGAAELQLETTTAKIFPDLEPLAQIIARDNRIYAIEASRYRVCALPDLGLP